MNFLDLGLSKLKVGQSKVLTIKYSTATQHTGFTIALEKQLHVIKIKRRLESKIIAHFCWEGKKNKPGIEMFITYVVYAFVCRFPLPCPMLNSLPRIMRKDSQLELNIDTGREEELEGKAKRSSLPKNFGDDCSFLVLVFAYLGRVALVYDDLRFLLNQTTVKPCLIHISNCLLHNGCFLSQMRGYFHGSHGPVFLHIHGCGRHRRQ